MTNCVHVQIFIGALDPVLPAALHRHIAAADWQELCENVELALRPAKRFNKFVTWLEGCKILFVFLFIVVGFGGMFLLVRDDEGDSDSEGSAFVFIFPFIIVMSLFGCLGSAISCFGSLYVDLKSQEELRSVLAEFSRDKPRVSFHLLQDGSATEALYLEGSDVSRRRVFATTSYVLQISLDSEVGVTASLNDAVASGASNPANRLKELDACRWQLTDNEYQEKRREILASL